MNFSATIKMSINTLKRQRLRSALTILGIAVGISIVIAIMSAGRGLDKMIVGEMEAFGADTLTIETKVPGVKKTSSENAVGLSTGITITTLKDNDLETVLRHPNITTAYGWVIGQAVASYAGQNKTVLLAGEGATMPEVEAFEIDDGRFYTDDEEKSLAQVAVLGATVKENLFGGDEAVGKTMYIKGRPFRVVGVAKKRGSAFFMDMDNIIFLPCRTMQKRILGIDYVRAIMAKMKNGALAAQTAEELTELIRLNHNISDPDKDDFAVNTMEEARDILGNVVAGITFLLVALVCVSLLVGGVGIMNIMYVSVVERTFEIGLRKAVGARRRDIMGQFLSEAVLITTAGGAAGVALGAGLALVIYFAAVSYGLKWAYIVPMSSILLAVGFSAFIGLLFGLYPARKAAALDPIEALRRE